MSHDRRRDPGQAGGAVGGAGGAGGAGTAPGKRTLTEGLPTAAAAPAPAGDGQPLAPAVRTGMEASFDADFSSVRVHEGGKAADAGAIAYAQGADLHFAPGAYQPQSDAGRALIGHELAHVVQQAEGRVGATAQAKGVAINDDDGLEREADDLGARAARGEAVRAPSAAPIAPAAGGAVQRYAFVKGAQLDKGHKGLSAPALALVKDKTVRDYDSQAEFEQHATHKTDYLGNLAADGTWLRFSPSGINLLGENHTNVRLDHVAPAVGSTSFIYEPFSSDDLTDGSAMKNAYEGANVDWYKRMGIDGVKDKKQFGAESLYPKIGFTMTIAQPYFDGSKPIEELKPAGYVGKPVQRYLSIAWGLSKDNKADVAAKHQAKQKVSPRLEALAAVHAAVEGPLDAFITALPVEGFLGDALAKKGADALLPHLAKFSAAVIDAMVEMAIGDPSSHLTDPDKQKLGSDKATLGDKQAMFGDWRNHKFEESVAAAAKRGVRYAGMGLAHLTHLQDAKLMPTGSHPFDMDGDDLQKFQDHTAALAKKAVPQ